MKHWKLEGILADADKREISGVAVNTKTGERAWFKSPQEGPAQGTPAFLHDVKLFAGRTDAGIAIDVWLLHIDTGRAPAEILKGCGL